jgi:CD109 antigen
MVGYQNELNFLHNDGSFSAFGNNDKNGSSWLTAFVLKSFSQAKSYSIIDEFVLKRSIQWLLEQQNEDGSFNEPGDIIHKDMQGGVNNKLTITAYIIISLLEADILDYADISADYFLTERIQKAIQFLQDFELNLYKDDTYSLALLSYTFALCNSKFDKRITNPIIVDFVYDTLKTKSKMDKANNLFWSKGEEESDSDIEITSYALLTYLLKNDEADNALLIVRWLVSKSNSLGAYSSTQNTILALQALSQFGQKIFIRKQGKSSLVIVNFNIISNNNQSVIMTRQFEVNRNNSLLLQIWQLPRTVCSDPSIRIQMNATGTGIVMIQKIVTFNTADVEEEPTYELNQIVKHVINNDRLLIQTCIKYFDKTMNESAGMTVIEATPLGGFAADQQELDHIVNRGEKRKLKMIEKTKNNKVAFYLNGVDREDICIDWIMTRTIPVTNLKAVPVVVYDYYRPDMKKTILFEPKDRYKKTVNSVCKLKKNVDGC